MRRAKYVDTELSTDSTWPASGLVLTFAHPSAPQPLRHVSLCRLAWSILSVEASSALFLTAAIIPRLPQLCRRGWQRPQPTRHTRPDRLDPRPDLPCKIPSTAPRDTTAYLFQHNYSVATARHCVLWSTARHGRSFLLAWPPPPPSPRSVLSLLPAFRACHFARDHAINRQSSRAAPT